MNVTGKRRQFLRVVRALGGHRQHAKLETARGARAEYPIREAEAWYVAELRAGRMVPDVIDLWFATTERHVLGPTGVARLRASEHADRR